jgi:hypothetical protein
MQAADYRQEIDGLIAAGDAAGAARRLSALWEREGGARLAGFVASRYEKLRGRLPLVRYRWAVLRSFTVEPIVPILRASAFTRGIDLETHTGEFNAYAQEILDPDSSLYRFHPDAVVLAVQTRDLAPALWRDYARLGSAERVAAADGALVRLGDWVKAFRANSQAALIVHSLETPAVAVEGILDGQAEENQAQSIRRINRGLRMLGRQYRGVYILDYDALVARHGRETWGDERKWLTVRLPVASAPGRGMAALPASAHGKNRQVRGGGPGQHAVGRRDRRGRYDRNPSGTGVSRGGLSGSAEGAARFDRPRHFVGRLQQEQFRRRYGGAGQPPRHGAAAARFRGHADQLE